MKAVRESAISILESHESSQIPIRTLIRETLDKQLMSLHDRVFLNKLTLGVTRYRNTIDYILRRVQTSETEEQLVTKHLHSHRLALLEARWLHTPIKELTEEYFSENLRLIGLLKRAINLDLARAIAKQPITNRLSIQYSHPTFLVETLMKNLPKEEALALMTSNNEPHVYYVRKNSLLSSDDIPSCINGLDVQYKQDRDLAWLYQVTDGIDKVISSEEFKTGHILIQDKASVMAVLALNPEPGDRIWDACAAPGQKTQLIWELMQQNGRLVAMDFNEERVASARNRCKGLGCEDVEWISGDASRIELEGINKILIDAPCSSTGMMRSHPSFKWRLNKETLMSTMTIQNKILEAILTRNPGVEVVYATCSILPHEGESQIESVCSKHEIEFQDLSIAGSYGYKSFEVSKHVRRFFPHVHDTNGFFISKIVATL